jgi:hypothetical protein
VNQIAAMDKIELAVFKKQKESFNVHSVVICESECDGPNPLKNKKRASMCTVSSSMNQMAVMDQILSQ